MDVSETSDSNEALELPNFDDTKRAFSIMNTASLRRSIFLFSLLQKGRLMKILKGILNTAIRLRLPVGPIVRPLVFKHFCGGETLIDCVPVIEKLNRERVGSIPDYSVEGKDDERSFDAVKQEVLKTIALAGHVKGITSAVFKPSGIGPVRLWEKLSFGLPLDDEEQIAYNNLDERLDEIFRCASGAGVPVMVDAEEICIQPAVDAMVRRFSETFNRQRILIYNTVQMYRTDRLSFMKAELVRAISRGYMLGYKIVRGAYHEQEMNNALGNGYPSPVFTIKSETDDAYNTALVWCFENRDRIGICAATHNEQSTILLARLISEQRDKTLPAINFAQLYGMSDNLSFNLAASGYNVAKYLPYGPLRDVMPYLLRRAEENRSIDGQTGRELTYLRKELARRKSILL